MFDFFRHKNTASNGGAVINAQHSLVINLQNSAVQFVHAAANAHPLTIAWQQPKDNISSLLTWHSRLPHTLHGRDGEIKQLIEWANRDDKLGVFLLHGAGGVGKTRLAFEFAQRLQDAGWQAGAMQTLHAEHSYCMGETGTLLILDYPEEQRETTQKLLELLANGPEPQTRLRVLLLGRNASVLQGLQEHSRHLCDGDLALQALQNGHNATHAFALFSDAWAAIQNVRGQQPKPLPVGGADFQHWLNKNAQHSNPLLVLAYALHLNDSPESKETNSAKIVEELVQRETQRLQNEAHTLRLPATGYVLLKALAAITDGLNAGQLQQLINNAPATPRLPDLEGLYQSSEGQGQCIVPLRPDLLAAQLLDSVLQQCQPQVGAWLYQTLVLGGTDQQFLSNALSRLGRLRHDWAFTLRPPHQIHEADPWLDALIQYAQEDFERCRTLERVLCRDYLEQPLVPLAIAVTQAYIDMLDACNDFDAEPDQSNLAKKLNNLSVRLGEAGKPKEALATIQRAVAIHEKLAEQNPAAYTADLASSLNNLSVRLAAAGKQEEALAAIQRAVAIREQLAEQNSAAYAADLASSLNNLSNRLAAAGKQAEALAAIQRAVAIHEQLAEQNPAAYAADLAVSLNNLSVDLAAMDKQAEALAAIQRAVVIYEKLAEQNPAAYAADLANSLNNLSVRLAAAGKQEDALIASRRACEMIKPFAKQGTIWANWQKTMQHTLHKLEQGDGHSV